jgi:cobalt-zinc-cadmium efflux system membrane fusion protein
MRNFLTSTYSVRAAVSLCLLSGFVLTLSACRGASETDATKETKVEDPMVVQVAAEQASNYKTGRVISADVALVQEHPGRVEANERQVSRIGATVTGRVTKVLAELGDVVRPGQVLAQVSSPELTTAQLAFLRAQSNQALAERAVDRARQLIQADVIGSAELLRRESELSIARAEKRAAEDQLRLAGLPSDAIEKLGTTGALHPEAGVITHLGGVVVERKVSQGQVVQTGEQLFTVADLSKVWVVGSLPEQAARSVYRGQTVEIEVPAIDRKMSGRVVFVSDTIQPETRTVTVRTELENRSRELKPQMLANMRLASAAQKMVVIPDAAVVREGDKDHVFVEIGANTYRLVPVELAPTTNHQRPVLKGLHEGDTIVVDGGFHLNNDRAQRLLTGAGDTGNGVKK